MIRTTLAALTACTALAAPTLALAQTAEPAACRKVSFSDVGWTDITATNAVAGILLALRIDAYVPLSGNTYLINGIGAVFIGALLTIFTIWLVNGLVWFARLHYRLLKPALEPTSVQSTSTSGASA